MHQGLHLHGGAIERISVLRRAQVGGCMSAGTGVSAASTKLMILKSCFRVMGSRCVHSAHLLYFNVRGIRGPCDLPTSFIGRCLQYCPLAPVKFPPTWMRARKWVEQPEQQVPKVPSEAVLTQAVPRILPQGTPV